MNYYSLHLNCGIDYEDIHLNICKYFLNILVKLDNIIRYNKISELEEFKLIIIFHETNIWAVLDRINDYGTKKLT